MTVATALPFLNLKTETNPYDEAKQYHPNPLSEYIYYEKYSRWNNDLGRRETWPETVQRAVDYLRELSDYRLDEDVYREIHLAILRMEVLPSMRLMAMAGEAARRSHITLYNCSYLPIDSLDSFVEAMILSMSGTGVGYSVEGKYVSKLPVVIPQKLDGPMYTHRVLDSAEGWADAFKLGLYRWFNGNDINFDYSLVRPAGSVLRTKGGRASGPDPLKNLLSFTRSKILEKQGKALSTLDCHDIMGNVALGVVSGGVRRSAMIALYDWQDQSMRHCKDGEFWNEAPWRTTANNSAVMLDHSVDDGDLRTHFRAMVDGGNGEPGIFSRSAAQSMVPGRRTVGDFGTNPCFHPDTLVETVYGPKRIKDITEPTYVYSMNEFGRLCIKRSSAAWKTRTNAQTLTITIANGSTLSVTPEHNILVVGRGWIKAQDIKLKDKVVALCRQRRGAKYSGVKLTSEGPKDFRMEHRLIWEGVNGPIPEDYDINHIDMDTYNNSIDNLEALTHSDHARLTRFSVPNNHQVHDPVTGNFISGPNSCHGKKKIVEMPPELKSSFHQYPTVEKIELGDVTDVYDISVEDTHNLIANGIVAHNCAEINLNPRQFCNLTEVVLRTDDTWASILRKTRLATIVGTIQSSATHFPGLSSVWRENSERERLLGVGFTGQMDCLAFQDPRIMRKARACANMVNDCFSELLEIERSAAITCVKPSGSTAILAGVSSGLHTRWSPYYIRRFRMLANGPLSRVLRQSGVPLAPENGYTDSNTPLHVVSYVAATPNGLPTRLDRSAIDQCEYWKLCKLNLTEHNPSVTITFQPHEVQELEQWVVDNRGLLGGMAFLPAFDESIGLQQMPYESIDRARYQQLLDSTPDIDYSLLSSIEQEDQTTAAQEVSCSSGFCEL